MQTKISMATIIIMFVILGIVLPIIRKILREAGGVRNLSFPELPFNDMSNAEPVDNDEVTEAAILRESWSYDDMPTKPQVVKRLPVESPQVESMNTVEDRGVIDKFDVATAIIYSELLNPKFKD